MTATKSAVSAFFLAAVVAISSCSDPSTVGIDVIPDATGGNTFFTDTITIEASIVREDSLKTDEATALFNLAGSYTDPAFGLSRASFYTQFRLPNNNANFSFGTSPVLDSVVLTLAYADYYGDTITQQQFEVYRLDASMYKDTNYYSNDVIITGTQLFNGLVSINPRDSVELGGVNKAPHLRLKLDDALGTEFLDQANAGKFVDNATFIEFFKGIHVKAADVTTSGSGCIASFNLQSSMSKLTFYYSNTTADSLAANFEVNGDCPRFNHFEHDYTTAEFGNTFPVTPANNKLYVQSMAGVKTRIKFPYLAGISPDGAVAINKAELVIPAIENSFYKTHTNLLVFGVDSSGKESIIPDLLESSAYYGGAYETATQEFKFNIARYVQQLVSGNMPGDGVDYGLSIISSGGPVNALRTIIPGPLSADKKLKLRITYSKLR